MFAKFFFCNKIIIEQWGGSNMTLSTAEIKIMTFDELYQVLIPTLHNIRDEYSYISSAVAEPGYKLPFIYSGASIGWPHHVWGGGDWRREKPLAGALVCYAAYDEAAAAFRRGNANQLLLFGGCYFAGAARFSE